MLAPRGTTSVSDPLDLPLLVSLFKYHEYTLDAVV